MGAMYAHLTVLIFHETHWQSFTESFTEKSSLVTEPLNRDWDLPGTQFDNTVPLLEVPMAEEDILFTSELVELPPFR